MRKLSLPPQLKAGDVIGLIAPSHVARAERYGPIIRVIESLGFQVKLSDNFYKDTCGYSATERERADDLNAMAADPQVKMVFFGGGEGANELLPYIDYDTIARNPKAYLSYSDGTTILASIHARTGLLTYYGQAPGDYEDLRYYNHAQLIRHIVDGPAREHLPAAPWTCVVPGACEGTLVGGYLSNFARMLETPYFPYDDQERCVLFLEDHEKFSGVAAVSAWLAHIQQSPFASRISGLLFGHYARECPPELIQRLARFGRDLGVPVACCDDFGHGIHHAILPIGARARLDAETGKLTYDYPAGTANLA